MKVDERLRTAISVFLSFTLLVSLVCIAGILLIRFTLLDPDRLIARFGVDELAGGAYERLTEAFDSYGVSAGIAMSGGAASGDGEAFYAQVLTPERVRADLEAGMTNAFDSKTPAPDIDGFRAGIDEAVKKTAEANGTVLTSERSGALTYLSELCAEAYGSAITVPAAVRLASLSERARELTQPLVISGALLLAASCAFLIALHRARKRAALIYIIYGVIGAALFMLLFGI